MDSDYYPTQEQPPAYGYPPQAHVYQPKGVYQPNNGAPQVYREPTVGRPSVNSTNDWPRSYQHYSDDGDDPLLAIESEVPPPKSHLALNIVVTLLCCLPLGIAGIVFSSKTMQAISTNDNVLATRHARHARNLGISGLVIGFVVTAVVITLRMILMTHEQN